MSFNLVNGDLLKADVDAIVNTVNCVGVMGKGIALQFRQKWPENYTAYKKECDAGAMRTGRMFVYGLGTLAGRPHYIINFPTKEHWKGKSQLSFITAGLVDLVRVIQDLKIQSIAIPPLGCGNGGLDWNIVRPLIKQALEALGDEVKVYVFEPVGAPKAEKLAVRTQKPKMTPGRAILIKLLSLYREMEYSLSKIEVQKLCYFAQEAGEPLRLKFEKNQYGPYAQNLRHVLTLIDGHYLSGVGDHDTSTPEIHLKEGALAEADVFLQDRPESNERLNRVAALIEGFETPFGMELLATVHWVAKRECPSDDVRCIVNGVHNWERSQPSWNERKRSIMTDAQIQIAVERLKSQKWI